MHALTSWRVSRSSNFEVGWAESVQAFPSITDRNEHLCWWGIPTKSQVDPVYLSRERVVSRCIVGRSVTRDCQTVKMFPRKSYVAVVSRWWDLSRLDRPAVHQEYVPHMEVIRKRKLKSPTITLGISYGRRVFIERNKIGNGSSSASQNLRVLSNRSLFSKSTLKWLFKVIVYWSSGL